ncbi:hypothetical protein Q9233_004056 [Columba guinea]|nr:hypothetical protein Q9233_004056 [Columba guinea]
MDEVYQISSTEKVQQLEQELAVQLAELKAEIEDKKILRGTTNRAYSQEKRSIQHVVRLQVAEAKPLVIQADVMQRELESCWRREHTAANLPLLLRQAGEDHGASLAQQAALCTFGKENSMKLLPENRHENVSACSFLVLDIEKVMEGLQEHAAAVFRPHPAKSSSATFARASGQQSYDHFWEEIYASTELHQELTTKDDYTAVAHSGEDVGNMSSASVPGDPQLLSLKQPGEKPDHQYHWPLLQGWSPICSAEDTSCVSAAKGDTDGFGGMSSQLYIHYTPADYKVRYHPAFSLPKHVCQQEYLIQLLDVNFEAYQHALDPEERFALAQAITDIMHKHPWFDLKLEYFVNTYKDKCIYLQLHFQLLRDIVNQQVYSGPLEGICYRLAKPSPLEGHLLAMSQGSPSSKLVASKASPSPDSLSFHPRSRSLLSPNGLTFLNVWFNPYPTEVLIVFKKLAEKLCAADLQRLCLPLQLCLCSLADADPTVTHGQLPAMQFLMEDVLHNSYGSAVEDHADCPALSAKSKQVPLTVWDCTAFIVGILYLAMQAIVRQKGTEEQFGEPISSTQQILPPRGVSETKMKVYQVRGRLFHGVLLGTTQHQIVGLRHGMIMEITAPRAQLADLEEENLSLKEKMRKEVRDEYKSLVQDLFVTCVHLKGNLDVYRLSIEQRLFEIISKVRREGVGNMIDLKKKFGSTKNNGDLKEHLSKEALQSKKEGLNAKLMAEQGVTLFQAQLGMTSEDWSSGFKSFRIRSQLTQENSLKPEAFQQVDELQCQVDDREAAVSQRNVTAGKDTLCVVTRFLGK